MGTDRLGDGEHAGPGDTDRHHQQHEQEQVGRKHPARDTGFDALLGLDDHDMELARQTENRQCADERLGKKVGTECKAPQRLGAVFQASILGKRAEIAHRQHRHGNEGRQFDHRLTAMAAIIPWWRSLPSSRRVPNRMVNTPRMIATSRVVSPP